MGVDILNGIVAVWKESGMTSHDVVFKLRRIFGMKRVGHTGTLDPAVEGVLVVCLGQATKLVELLMDGKKVYQGEITLGTATTTEDAEGEVVSRKAVDPPLTTEEIDKAMESLQGTITQIPPYYSAVKVKGKRLYEYAREGIEVERPRRRAQINYFKRTSSPIYNQQDGTQKWSFEVECGKGTYVRTLAVDLGEKLGYPSHMSYLRRIETGGFKAAEALTLNQLEDLKEKQALNEAVYPMERAIENLPQLNLTEAQMEKVQHGSVVEETFFDKDFSEPVALFYSNKLQAIYQAHPSKKGLVKPFKMFINEKV